MPSDGKSSHDPYNSTGHSWPVRVQARTSKQLNILRKLKYRLQRDYLEKIYLVFIRPILEYASEVWDNCGQANRNRLEKIQI
jgi:hypothetical protein